MAVPATTVSSSLVMALVSRLGVGAKTSNERFGFASGAAPGAASLLVGVCGDIYTVVVLLSGISLASPSRMAAGVHDPSEMGLT